MLIPLLALVVATLAPDSTRWIVSNHGREAGDLVVITTADSVRARFVFTDRNRGTRVESRYRLSAAGAWTAGETRVVLSDGSAGPVTDAFEVLGDSIRFGASSGNKVPLPKGTFAALRTVTPWEQAALARWLLAQPDRRGSITRGGDVRATIIADTALRIGTRRQRARLVMISRGASPSPSGVWLDEKGALLATDVQWFITVRPDLVGVLPEFRAIELKWRATEGEALARKAITPVAGSLVIRNGNLFDSERGMIVPRQTVVVRNDRIVAAGPAESTDVPSNATVIDATGKTIMPGLWEMHTHLQVSNQGALGLTQLAQGLTTARDLASDIDVAVSQRDRERAGKLATPRIILAGFMEGPLAWAGPTATVVSTEAEARGWVARYDSLGYKQIKLYNVLHPDLVPVIAAEAHKRGMLLSGHIPRGMSMQAAVGLGYDEVQHAAFFFSNAFPDSLYLPQMRAYSQVATAVAPTIDVNSLQMTSLIQFLREHHTVIDGTFNLWIGGGGALVGAGGSANQAKADSAYMTLIRRLYAAGVPMVAGTDNSSGTTYRRELEMYALAGIPASKILQMATIESARFMKDANDYGSLTVGKVADILVVDGAPAERISDLQKVETVIRGGRLYKVSDLLRLSGGAIGGASGSDGDEWLGAFTPDHDPIEPATDVSPAERIDAPRLDNGLARTPPMGWNSWNKFGCNVSDKLIREVADAINANGMRDAGYRYVTIDDCWQVARDASGVIVADSMRFPAGMKALADYVHSKGLGFGIYTDAGRKTCEGRPGSYGYEAIDAKTYASWGVDYVKIDWCNSEGLDARKQYTIFRDALAASGRKIVFSICEWGSNEPWDWASSVGNLWRTTFDIADRWSSLISIVDLSSQYWHVARPGAWNDPDMLEVGNGGMTQTEYRAHFSLWAMMAAPLIAGNDVRTMMDSTRAAAGAREILLNKEVIAVDQDSLGVQGKIVQASPNELQVWVKPLADGSRAVLLFNRASVPSAISVDLARVGLKTKTARVRDLWAHTETPVVNDRVTAPVPSHGVVMLRVWPIQ